MILPWLVRLIDCNPLQGRWGPLRLFDRTDLLDNLCSMSISFEQYYYDSISLSVFVRNEGDPVRDLEKGARGSASVAEKLYYNALSRS